jgi:hypothetical protein
MTKKPQSACLIRLTRKAVETRQSAGITHDMLTQLDTIPKSDNYFSEKNPSFNLHERIAHLQILVAETLPEIEAELKKIGDACLTCQNLEEEHPDHDPSEWINDDWRSDFLGIQRSNLNPVVLDNPQWMDAHRDFQAACEKAAQLSALLRDLETRTATLYEFHKMRLPKHILSPVATD